MPEEVSILHVLTRLAVGGAGMNTLLSCRDIRDEGFRSELVVGPERPPEGDYFHLAAQFGITTTICPHLVWRISPLHDMLALYELTNIIKQGGYTIVHTHGSKARLLGRAAARLSGCSPMVVQTFHGWPFDSQMSFLLQAAYTTMERVGFRLAHQSVAVTPEDIFKGSVWGIGSPGDYTVIRSGVEFGPFKSCRGRTADARAELGLPADCPVVGTVARLAPVKDPLTFLAVASRIHEKLPQCRFVMIGDGPMRPEVERRVDSSGLSDALILAGNRTDVCSLLPAFDVFLITSVSEGLPRGMLESLASGVPVVSTDVGGVSELLTGTANGMICPVGDPGCLAGRVLEILTTPGLSESLLQNVDSDLEPFSAEKMVSDLRTLYNCMAKQRAGH
ncbi:MAG: glycosyltransferase [Candidatus Fermentibacteraceae bacterium]